MRVDDSVVMDVPGKGRYENCLEDGEEVEYLNGVGLLDGHFCKHYTTARNWSDRSALDASGQPLTLHYCAKNKRFMGCAYCCGRFAKCFEKGKSAGVKRLRNRIRKQRLFGEG